MSFISLWIRLFSLVLIMVLSIAIIFIIFKNYNKSLKLTLVVMIVVFFIFAIFKVLFSIINPNITSCRAIYDGFSKESQSINFFAVEYCFIINGEKVYIDTDIISEKILCPDGIEQGQIYEISFEKTQNLILEIAKTETKKTEKTGDG